MVETMSFQQSQNIWMLEVYPDFSRGAIKSLENHYLSFPIHPRAKALGFLGVYPIAFSF